MKRILGKQNHHWKRYNGYPYADMGLERSKRNIQQSRVFLRFLVLSSSSPVIFPAKGQEVIPKVLGKRVEQFARVEFVISLDRLYNNPFDPREVEVDIELTTPKGDHILYPAFYYQPYEIKILKQDGKNIEWIYPEGKRGWRARFAPTEQGKYTCSAWIRDKEGIAVSNTVFFRKYNVYGAFIEKSVKLLKVGGQLMFIVPATFMILDEFKKLRAFLSREGGTAIIYLGADVFKRGVNVACAILNLFKSQELSHRMELFKYHRGKLPLIATNPHREGEVITFQTEYTRKLESGCEYRLKDIYEVRISPRMPEMKNNPLIVKSLSPPSEEFIPLLNGRNLKRKQVIYENFTGYRIRKEPIQKLKDFFGSLHIVVGLSFREGGKVAAAYDYSGRIPQLGGALKICQGNLSGNHIPSKYNQLENFPLLSQDVWQAIRRGAL